MNKYFLSFYDSKTESQYLAQKWENQRAKDFKYISISVVVVFLIKVAMTLLSQNYELFIFKIIMPCYTVIQYIFVKRNPRFSRIALILLNIGITLTKLESDDTKPLVIIEIQNINLLLANIMIFFSGEFVEAFILFLVILLSIFVNVTLSSVIYLPTMLSTSSGSLFMIKYLHQYHQGQRSAFLLKNTDNEWDKVIQKLIHHSYILLEFNYTNLEYTIINQSLRFEINQEQMETITLKNDKFPEAQYFIKNAQVEGINLQNFIFKEIQGYQTSFSDQNSRLIYIKFHKQLVQIDYSIFRAKELKILLQIKDIKSQNYGSSKQYEERLLKYNEMFLKLLNKIKIYQPENKYILKLRKQFSFIKYYEEIMQQKFNEKSLNICQFIILLKNLYPLEEIRFESNIQSFTTFPNIFLLLIMIIMNSSRNENLFFTFTQIDDLIALEIMGSFKVKKYQKYFKQIKTQVYLIVQRIEASGSYFTFHLYSQPLLPFSSKKLMHDLK